MLVRPKRDRTRFAQLGDDRRVIRRDVALENFRRARARVALHVDHVLDRDGHAAKRLGHIGRVGLGARLGCVEVEIGLELGINFGHARVELIDNLARLHRARGKFLPEFRNGQAGHDCSMMRGTTKRLFSCAGALASASATGRLGVNWSARKLVFQVGLAEERDVRDIDLRELADIAEDVAELLLERGDFLR